MGSDLQRTLGVKSLSRFSSNRVAKGYMLYIINNDVFVVCVTEFVHGDLFS